MSITPSKKKEIFLPQTKRWRENLLITYKWPNSLKRKILLLNKNSNKSPNKTNFSKAISKTFMKNLKDFYLIT